MITRQIFIALQAYIMMLRRDLIYNIYFLNLTHPSTLLYLHFYILPYSSLSRFSHVIYSLSSYYQILFSPSNYSFSFLLRLLTSTFIAFYLLHPYFFLFILFSSIFLSSFALLTVNDY